MAKTDFTYDIHCRASFLDAIRLKDSSGEWTPGYYRDVKNASEEEAERKRLQEASLNVYTVRNAGEDYEDTSGFTVLGREDVDELIVALMYWRTQNPDPKA